MPVTLPTNNEAYPFCTDVEVRLGDLSGGVHLGNNMIVNYTNEAMARLFKAMGFGGLVINGVSYINQNLEITFLSEGDYGDRITIYAAIESFEERQYTLIFRLYNQRTQRELAHLRSLYVSFDYQQRKRAPVPAELIAAYQLLKQSQK